MKNLLVKNIFHSVLEKAFVIFFQFLISLLMIRNLDRALLGIIAVVGGCYALVNFINFPLENFLLKEDKSDKEKLNKNLNQYITFSFKKCLVFIVLAFLGTCFVMVRQESINYHYAIWSFCFILILDTMASPFIMLASIKLKQSLVVKMSLVRWSLSFILLLPLISDPSLKWLLIKDILVAVSSLALWIYFIRKLFNLNAKIEKLELAEAWKKFKIFTFWTHLTGSVSAIIYKSDAVVLSWFSSLSTVGSYNIALNAGNIANIVPSLLAYQNSVALSHSTDNEKSIRVTIRFFRLTFYISLLTLVAYLLLGKIYLRILTGHNNNEEIYIYMINIVIGILMIKTLISPIVAFINIKGDVKSLFLRVQLPLLFVCLLNYILFSKFLGAFGLSLANIVNAIIWVLLIMLEIRHYHFKIKDVFNIKEDLRDIKYYAQNFRLLH